MAELRTPREAMDFYPTPRDAVAVLANWLADRADGPEIDGSFVDPAAGTGSIVEAMRDRFGESHWTGIEIAESRFVELESVVENPIHGNALDLDWPEAHAIENPPFGLLDEFWRRTSAHRERARVWCAVFTPVAWWNAEKRASYVRPDFIMSLGWRPVFRDKAGPAHKGSQDFAWSILAPKPRHETVWLRVEKPREAVAP